MQAPVPTEVLVPEDPASGDFTPAVPPCGSFNMTVVEGKDLAKMDIGGSFKTSDGL
jgi:hypothetical protein